MQTVGKIFSATQNNYSAFNTQAETVTGSINILTDRVIFPAGATRVALRPDIIHSYDAFNISVDAELSGFCNLEIGLEGRQINWPVNATVNIINDGDEITYISFRVGYETRFTEILPFMIQGLVKIRVTYERLTWGITIIYGGASYSYSYAYQRPAVNGHTTGRFTINNLNSETAIFKVVVDVPLLKGLPLFVGDSIVWGAGRVFGSRTFAEQYRATDGRANIFASGSAASGDLLHTIEAIKLLEPTEIYLLIGDNDDFSQPANFEANMQTLIQELINPASGIATPVLSLMNLTPEAAQPGYAALRDVINAIALSSPHRKINSWGALARTDNPDLADPINTVDGVHLSPSGHNKLYALL